MGWVGTPQNTHATSDTVTGTWGTGQTRTAGDVLLAAVTCSGSTAEYFWCGNSTPGWVLLGFAANSSASTSEVHVTAALFGKYAQGSDAAPEFNCGAEGTIAMDCTLLEVSGAALQVDAVGTYSSSGTGTGSATVTFSVTTSTDVSETGEYAVSVFGQMRTTAGSLTWTESGSGWTSALAGNGVSSELQTAVNFLSSPTSGAELSDSGHFSTDSTAYGAGIVVVLAAAGTQPQLINATSLYDDTSEATTKMTVSSAGGTTLVLCAGFYAGSTLPAIESITDSSGNDWDFPAAANQSGAGTPPAGSVYYTSGGYSGLGALAICGDAAAITDLTVTFTQSGDPTYLVLLEFRNLGSPKIAASVSSDTLASGSTYTSPSITPGSAPVVLVAVSSVSDDNSPVGMQAGWMLVNTNTGDTEYDAAVTITNDASAQTYTWQNYETQEWLGDAVIALIELAGPNPFRYVKFG